MLNVFYTFNKDFNAPPEIEKVIFYIENVNYRERRMLFGWSHRFLVSFIDSTNKEDCLILEESVPIALNESYLRIKNCAGHLNSIMIEMTGKAPIKEYKRYLDALMKEFSIPIVSDNAKKQYMRLNSNP